MFRVKFRVTPPRLLASRRAKTRLIMNGGGGMKQSELSSLVRRGVFPTDGIFDTGYETRVLYAVLDRCLKLSTAQAEGVERILFLCPPSHILGPYNEIRLNCHCSAPRKELFGPTRSDSYIFCRREKYPYYRYTFSVVCDRIGIE